jgi:3'-phosphoadenosine 5'-phosphosulfate sulfotransferase (PAPS reductase)/FAD synthetase
MTSIHHLVSCSGGKDSTATLLLAMKQFPDSFSAVFADTGNEHEDTHEYLRYLERTLGISITRLKADFTHRFESKRKWVAEKWPGMGVSAEHCEEALSVLHPTGNPYLDLCVIKGRFPARMSQFCTSELKTLPLTEHAMDIIDMTGGQVWSWQGVRRDESPRRKNALGFEDLTGGIFAFRPIAGWTAQQTVDFVTKVNGIELNPLYKKGMSRVGCMPCINATKADIAEIAEISRRFPEHIERIARWEDVLRKASKRGGSSFFPSPTGDNRGEARGLTIYSNVEWARTLRGGKIQNPEYEEPAAFCASSYGLCE